MSKKNTKKIAISMDGLAISIMSMCPYKTKKEREDWAAAVGTPLAFYMVRKVVSLMPKK